MMTAGSPGVTCSSAKTAMATTPITGMVATNRRTISGTTVRRSTRSRTAAPGTAARRSPTCGTPSAAPTGRTARTSPRRRRSSGSPRPAASAWPGPSRAPTGSSAPRCGRSPARRTTRRRRPPAGEQRGTRAVVLLDADGRLQVFRLIDAVEERLPRLLVVEGRMLVVRADPALRSARVGDEGGESRVRLDLRQEVERRVLPPVDLARLQRGVGGGVIRHVAPDDTIQVPDLAAGGTARLLLTRPVVRGLHVDDLGSRLPLVFHELERAGADRLLDRLVLGRGRDPGRHDERHVRRGLAERVEDEAERLRQLERERLLVRRRQLRGVGGEQPAERVALRPPLERLHRVLGGHRGAVVELEAVAQRE